MMELTRHELNQAADQLLKGNSVSVISKILDRPAEKLFSQLKKYKLVESNWKSEPRSRWTTEERKTLADLIKKGYTYKMAARVFNRTHGSITQQTVDSDIVPTITDESVGFRRRPSEDYDEFVSYPEEKKEDDFVWVSVDEMAKLCNRSGRQVRRWCSQTRTRPEWFNEARKDDKGYWEIKVNSQMNFKEGESSSLFSEENPVEVLTKKMKRLEKQVEKNTSMLAKLYDTPIVRWFCKD